MGKNKKKKKPQKSLKQGNHPLVSKKSTSENQLIVGESFSGPLPHPNLLNKYEQTLPGAAERIIGMAERQSKHRQELEAKVIASDTRNSTLGLVFGFIIGLLGITGGCLLIYLGAIVEGSLFGGGTIIGLVTAFVYGSKQRRIERQDRQ